jgi:hypothetical protein
MNIEIHTQVTQNGGTRRMVDFFCRILKQSIKAFRYLGKSICTADREWVRVSYYLDIVADERLSTHIDTKTSHIRVLPINTRLRKCYNENIHFINLINSLETLGHVCGVQKETPFLFGNPVGSMFIIFIPCILLDLETLIDRFSSNRHVLHVLETV